MSASFPACVTHFTAIGLTAVSAHACRRGVARREPTSKFYKSRRIASHSSCRPARDNRGIGCASLVHRVSVAFLGRRRKEFTDATFCCWIVFGLVVVCVAS